MFVKVVFIPSQIRNKLLESPNQHLQWYEASSRLAYVLGILRKARSTKARTMVQSPQRADFVKKSRVYIRSPTNIHDRFKAQTVILMIGPLLF